MDKGETRKSETSPEAAIDKEFFTGHVRRVKWDVDLGITFDNGYSYRYANVPRAVVEQLLAAESRGTFLNQNVKGVYACQKVASL